MVLRDCGQQQTCVSHGPTKAVGSGHFVARPYAKQRSRDITCHLPEDVITFRDLPKWKFPDEPYGVDLQSFLRRAQPRPDMLEMRPRPIYLNT